MSNNIDRIQEIRDRQAAATQGSWDYFETDDEQLIIYDNTYFNRHIATIAKDGVESREREKANANLIVYALDDIAYLLSEYDRLTEGHDVALKALEKAEKFITTMMEFYGEGLTVHNWHQNGDGEPWDNFFDNNMEGDELESIRTALSHLKG